MKKWLCMALAMMLILTSTAAFAAPTVTTNFNTVVGKLTPTDAQTIEKIQAHGATEDIIQDFVDALSAIESIAEIDIPQNESATCSAEYFDEGTQQWMTIYATFKGETEIYPESLVIQPEDYEQACEVIWTFNAEGSVPITCADQVRTGKPTAGRLVVNGKEYYFEFAGILDEHGNVDYVKFWEKLAFIMPYDEDDTITYSHNSVCSFGPHYRDLEEAKTDKWYTFSVIDVSQDGKQVLPLIGGNVYIIGFVTIERKGDALTLTTRYLPDVWVYDEFYTLFPDYESITPADIENLTDGYAFGQTLSIANDLGGDTSLILQVRNEATFKSDNKAIRRFYENLDEFKAWRRAMLAEIGKTETTVPMRYDVAPKH